jgi:hypothetical protein
MSRARTPHDPLRGHNWRDGVEPAPEPIPAPQQEPDVDYSLDSKEHLMEIKAVAIVKRLYGIRGPFDWKPAIHDKRARAVYNMLMQGEELPRHWRTQHKEPPPINPDQWLTPRQRSS